MSYFGSKDYYVEVAAGRVAGSAAGFAIGSNAAVGATNTEAVWDVGGNYTYLTSNTQLYISSSSASDTAVTVLLDNLDEDYAVAPLTVTTNGQTQVAFSAATGFRVRVAVVTGSTSPIGDLYIAISGPLTAGVPNTLSDVKAKIPLGTDTAGAGPIDATTDYASDNISHNGLYTVEAGKRLIVPRIITGTDKNDNIKISGRGRLFGGSWLNRNPIPLYQANSPTDFNPPLVITEKSDIEFRAIAGTAGSHAQVNMQFIIETI